MMREKIAEIIRDEVKTDIYHDLMNVDRAADAILALFSAERAADKALIRQAYAHYPCEDQGGCLDRSTCAGCEVPGEVDLLRAAAEEMAATLSYVREYTDIGADDWPGMRGGDIEAIHARVSKSLAAYQTTKGES